MKVYSVNALLRSKDDLNELMEQLSKLKFGIDLIEGKWYSLGKKGTILKYQGGKVTYGYVDGKFIENALFNENDKVNGLATSKEIESLFLKDAKSRYKKGNSITCPFGTGAYKTVIGNDISFKFNKQGNFVMCWMQGHIPMEWIVFSKGVWADVIKGTLFEIGAKFHTSKGVVYVLSSVGNGKCNLINIDNGRRYFANNLENVIDGMVSLESLGTSLSFRNDFSGLF